MLKTDFHMHIVGDSKDGHFLPFTGEQLIDYAREDGYDVLAFTCHENIPYNNGLIDYAAERGVLLIPGCEVTIEGRDVLILNITQEERDRIKTFDDLAKLSDEKLVIAPHPFFIGSDCLFFKIVRHRRLFHAVEYNFFYLSWLNFNWFSKLFAKITKKPLVGTSDFHEVWQLGYTYSLIDSEKNASSVISAIKHGKISIVTRPVPLREFIRVGLKHFH